MMNHDKLRELAQNVSDAEGWYGGDTEAMYVVTGDKAEFMMAISPQRVLALLDELRDAKTAIRTAKAEALEEAGDMLDRDHSDPYEMIDRVRQLQDDYREEAR